MDSQKEIEQPVKPSSNEIITKIKELFGEAVMKKFEGKAAKHGEENFTRLDDQRALF